MATKCTCEDCRASRILADIRRALRADPGATKGVYEAVAGLYKELHLLREHRPGDAPGVQAEVAGTLALLTSRLATWKPRQGEPLAIFEMTRTPGEK